MAKVEIYTRAQCSYCARAKQLFDSKDVQYTELRIDTDEALMQQMLSRSDLRTVPQIYIDDKLIGGFDDLAKLEHAGQLDVLLAK